MTYFCFPEIFFCFNKIFVIATFFRISVKQKKCRYFKFFCTARHFFLFSQDNVLLSRDNKPLSCTHKLAKSLSLSEQHKFEITTFIFVLPRYKKSRKQKCWTNKKKSSENKKKSSENKKNLEKTNLLKKCAVSPL